jgi:hypothetical protein
VDTGRRMALLRLLGRLVDTTPRLHSRAGGCHLEQNRRRRRLLRLWTVIAHQRMLELRAREPRALRRHGRERDFWQLNASLQSNPSHHARARRRRNCCTRFRSRHINPGTLRLPVAWRVAWRLPSVWLPPDGGLRWRLA